MAEQFLDAGKALGQPMFVIKEVKTGFEFSGIPERCFGWNDLISPPMNDHDSACMGDRLLNGEFGNVESWCQ
jgi:hypothetical protein